jgi:ABC-type bacteriocin/lantibiotic exporter with double-glycine peptidase domain
VADLERAIYQTSGSLRQLLSQALAICGSLAISGQVSTTQLLEMAATAITMAQTISSMSDLFETTRHLKMCEPTKDQLLPVGDDEPEERLWDELLDKTKQREYAIVDNNP